MNNLIFLSIGTILIYCIIFIANKDYKDTVFYNLNIVNMFVYLGLSIIKYLKFYKEINFINLISLILSLLTLSFTLIYFYKSNAARKQD